MKIDNHKNIDDQFVLISNITRLLSSIGIIDLLHRA